MRARAWPQLSSPLVNSSRVAARGLSLLYTLAADDKATQQQLVASLARTLGGAATTAPTSGLKLTGESELFPEGVIGQAPKSAGGGQLSTYRQLCSMASDVGQPELVYQFLQATSAASIALSTLTPSRSWRRTTQCGDRGAARRLRVCAVVVALLVRLVLSDVRARGAASELLQKARADVAPMLNVR